jgi:prepilin-type N-terminal cleavage/methylation domain-containing protein
MTEGARLGVEPGPTLVRKPEDAMLLAKRAPGFTLIEMMVVVAVIGILAAISIPMFTRAQMRARAGEGKTNLASIATAQEGYYAEFGAYVPCSGAPGTPGTPPGNVRMAWTDAGGFAEIGWAAEGDVYYQYGVAVAGSPANHFTAEAISDIDVDGQLNAWGFVRPSLQGSTIPGDLAGDASVDCPAEGSLDRQTETRLVATVGPCWPFMSQSIF